MYRLPEFWLPIALPIIFGLVSVVFGMLPLKGKVRTLSRFVLQCSTNTCLTCFAIDIWALTTAISTTPKAGPYTTGFIIAMAILFLAFHMLLYGLTLLAADEYESETRKRWFWVLTPPLCGMIFTVIAIFLVMIIRVRVWQVFYV